MEKPVISNIASALAFALLKKKLSKGEAISIPSLDIVINPKKDDRPA